MGCQHSNLIHNNFQKIQIYGQCKNEQPLKDHQNSSPLKPISSQLSGRQIILISNIIEKHILFYKLNQDQRMKLISSMEKFEVSHSTYIFKENDQPDYAFIISSGTVRIELTKDAREIKKILQQGSFFGDLALINVTKRSASAFAVTNCSLIALSKEVFHKKMEELAREHQSLFFSQIDCAPTFKKLTHTQKASLASHINEVRFEKDTAIFQLGDFANCIYLIKSGEIQVSVPKRSPVVLKKGDIFGQGSLKKNTIRSGQAKALTNAHCFVISRNKLSLCVQDKDITDITFHCIISWSLRRTNKYAKVSKALIEKIIESGEISAVEDRTVIITAGQQMTKLMICLEGEVLLEDLYKTLTKENQQIMGVGCIFSQDYQSPIKSPYTITKRAKGSLFTIDHTILKAIFHPIPHRMSISLQLPQPQINLKDFELIKILDSSHLTSKYLVMDNRAKLSYIMYVFNKYQTLQYKREKLLLNDKELNQSLKHNFIINIAKTLKDQNNIYFIYPEYLNFTLDSLIKMVNFPNIETINFIIMALINFIEFLHKQLIIFRDLKPDNIILDRNGYPHFVCFMLAKKLTKLNFKTYTIIGTPHYLAPEVQQGLGYSFPSDYWSLGVIIYQLAVGYLPFADDKEDPYDIFLAIQKQKLSFPKSYTNKKMKKFIKLLLSKESWNRPDHTNIKTCGYFEGMTEEKWHQLDQALTKCPKQIEKLITEFSEQLAQEALHETHGSLIAIFEKQRSKYNKHSPSSFERSWDDQF